MLAGGLQVVLDRPLAEGVQETLNEVGHALKAENKNVEQHTETLEGVRLVIVGDSGWVDLETVLTFQAAVAMKQDLR